jgi:hypothetical protein
MDSQLSLQRLLAAFDANDLQLARNKIMGTRIVKGDQTADKQQALESEYFKCRWEKACCRYLLSNDVAEPMICSPSANVRIEIKVLRSHTLRYLNTPCSMRAPA